MEQNGNDENKNIKSKIETKDATFDEGCIFWNLATILEISFIFRIVFDILLETYLSSSENRYKNNFGC